MYINNNSYYLLRHINSPSNSNKTVLHSNKKQKIAIKLSKVPYNALAGVFWVIGDLINTFVLNYRYQQDGISNRDRYDLVLARIVKILCDIGIFYIPATYLEKYVERDLVGKITPRFLNKTHTQYKPFRKIITLITVWLITFPLNEFLKPVINSYLTSQGLKSKDNIPKLLLDLFNLQKPKQ